MTMVTDQFKAEVDAYVDEVWEDVVEDIRSLVKIESVEDLDAAEPGKPWGPKSNEALLKGLEICERLGLEPTNLDGYLGYADLAGASNTVIATIAHTDIVPLGQGWTVDPLDVTRKDGYLLGRGVIDDKGPFALSAWAMHYFVRLVEKTGKPLPYTLRCIVGNNEETGMGDVDRYLEECGEPAFCFTPDADFPLICGEKGIMHGRFTSPWIEFDGALGPALTLEGGTVPNAVPGLASANVRASLSAMPPVPKALELAENSDGTVRVTAHGKGGHASIPAGTVNAINLLVRYLMEGGLVAAGAEKDFLTLVDELTGVSDGSTAGIACSDDIFGALTAVGGVISTELEGDAFSGRLRLTQTIDIRYPTATTANELVSSLEAFAARHGATFEMTSNADPFYIPPTSPEISALLATYREYTGDMTEPLRIGGGTYARHFARACAFGPNVSTEELPEWVGMEHGPDEGVSEERLRLALKIYIVAIARLMELEL